MAFTYVTVTRDYDFADGTDPGGWVTFTPVSPMINGGVTVVSAARKALLNVDGQISIDLAACTDTGTLPAGNAYRVVEQITDQTTRTYYVVIPHDAGASVDLGDLDTVAAPDLTATAQPLDLDLTVISGLTPTNDDVLQRKSGAWANRTMAQLATDLGLSGAGMGLLNVKDYGVVGDASTDDSAALKLAQAALTSGHALYFPPGCRVRFANTSPTGSAALRLSGLSRVGVVMAPGAELIMDNLSGGAGTSHGIYVTGSCDDVRLEGCRVRWATAPSSRSTGEAFRFLGYPSDSTPDVSWTTTTGPVTNVQMVNCTAINAPQCGAIFMGCSDIRVVNFRSDNTRADALHFNACRRANVNGHTAKWDSAIGDDGLAFVTYYHASTIWQGVNGPFNQPSLGAWSNADSQASGIVIDGGSADGCRIAGSLDVAVTGLVVKGKANAGIVIDSAIANGTSILWSYMASCGVAVSNLLVQDCPIGIYIPTQNVDSGSASTFWTFDARITGATIRGATNYSIRAEGNGTSTGVVAGLQLSHVRATAATSSTGGKGGISLSGLRDSRIDDTTLINGNGAQFAVFGQETTLSGALSGLARNNVSVGDILNVGGKILFQDINGLVVTQARSHSSPTDGVQFVRAVNVDVGAVTTYLANRGNTGTVRGLHFQKVLHCHVGRATVEHDTNTTTSWRSVEIGGGDATDAAAEDLRVGTITYLNTLNQTGSDINVQTGTGTPTNYQYALAWFNGGEASPAWRTATAYGPFATSGIAPDFQVFTSTGTWTKPVGATKVTIVMIGGGAGGGSGARRASGTATSGGGGGGGGGYTLHTLPASALSSTESVTVGGGGAAAAAITANDTNGSAGTNGTSSIFGSRKAIASGGGGGGAGANATANAGGGGSSALATGGNGGSCTTGAAGNVGSSGNIGGAGGGAGGGISTGAASFAGAAGGSAPQANLTGGAGGATDASGSAGTAATANLVFAGSGGGGGGASTTTVGGTGGAAGTYGAGGGGGGSSLNGQNSGAGGAGAAGIVVVISE